MVFQKLRNFSYENIVMYEIEKAKKSMVIKLSVTFRRKEMDVLTIGL